EQCKKEAQLLKMNDNIDVCENNVRSMIISAAVEHIPKKKIAQNKKLVPWWNDECSMTIKERNQAFKKFRKNMNIENLLEYKKKAALVRRTLKLTKRKAWREYCSNIGRETDIGDVWNMIKKMCGKIVYKSIPVLSKGDEIAVTEKEKADLLGKVFSGIHSGNHLTEYHKEKKEEMLRENRHLIIKKKDENSSLDLEFNLMELKRAIIGSKNSAPGQDQMSYTMFQHLPIEALNVILELFNKIWREGKVPGMWKRAIILPFLKPGKDPESPENYRPIALTSHLCKWMEKMIVQRLTYFLEKKGFINNHQCGFRKGRSTTDAMIKISNEIEKTISMKETMMTVYFDIEKAYDSMWREGLLIKMNKLGISGRLFNWVKSFLTNRSIMVKVGSEMSDMFNINNGVPQGSVISPILFNIMINYMFSDVGSGIQSVLYADDGVIWKRGKNIKFVNNKIQEVIKNVENWSYKWGFKISQTKSCYMLFSKKKTNKETRLLLYNESIEQVKEFKYL
ncbi:MAG: RNA-directed DNA polymerase, partial [Metamycoplasmataceae bacterium]